MIGPYRIEGYVIASMDGMIADAAGVMPPALELDADKRYFEEALNDIAAVVNGRRSEELHLKSVERRRLVLTRSVRSLAPEPSNSRALLWNPAGATLEVALAELGVESGRIAIAGGPEVYSLFLKLGYDVFHLCRAVRVQIPGGMRVFLTDRFDGEPDACLAAAGLKAGEVRMLDEEVSLVDWARPQ